MVTKNDILAAISAIKGPDGRTPLTESGAISGVTFRDGKAFVAIAIDPAQAASLEPMRAAVEAAVRKLPGVQSALVTLTAESTREVAQQSGQARAPQPSPAPSDPQGVPGVRQIIAVASGKGGVGKSTTACNIALGLARRGLKVGVLDADLYGPSMPRLFGLSGRPHATEDGSKLFPLERFGVKVMSIGFLVEDSAPIVWRGPMVMSALKQLLHDVAWGELDVLVIDMPPGTGDAQLTIAQSAPLAGAVIVSTPQDLALIDARRGVAMFQQVHVPILGVVENMSYFVCPHCGERSDIFAHGGARHEAEQIGVPFLGETPLHMTVRETSDAGEPLVATTPDSPQAQAYIAIADKVAAALASGAGGRAAPKITIA
ncbi:MAG: Mrp/NBP35 family ATP-binding protein [Hyphomicrobiales bacterium]|nr:Mrp/NBP35 family ATP-binding protein [Hyphomicrobiales bacterium]